MVCVFGRSIRYLFGGYKVSYLSAARQRCTCSAPLRYPQCMMLLTCLLRAQDVGSPCGGGHIVLHHFRPFHKDGAQPRLRALPQGTQSPTFVLMYFVRPNIPRECCQCCINVPIAFFRGKCQYTGLEKRWCCRDQFLFFECLPPLTLYPRRIGQANFFSWGSLPTSPFFCRLKIDRILATKTASASEKTATPAVGVDRSRIGRGWEEGLPWSSTHRGMPAVVCIPTVLFRAKTPAYPTHRPHPCFNTVHRYVTPAAARGNLQYVYCGVYVPQQVR